MTSRAGRALSVQFVRKYSGSSKKDVKHYKMVIAGGGTGGLSVAARACRAFGPGKVAIVEPAEVRLVGFCAPILSCLGGRDSYIGSKLTYLYSPIIIIHRHSE